MDIVVVTGGRGFVGSHLVEHILKNTEWNVVVFDKLSYASILNDRLSDMDIWSENQSRISFYALDLNLGVPKAVIKEVGSVRYIFHLAAESHVDRSISDPVPFVMNNVASTLSMLEYARSIDDLEMFVNFSTDEVYGPAPDGVFFKEFQWHRPSNPYSASKSAQEAIGIAYENTYGVPVITTHTMNIIGERQHPEKMVPKVVRCILDDEVMPIHASKDGSVVGSRCYLHARNLADALLHIVSMGFHGYDEWNIAGVEEIDNLELAMEISRIIGKPLRYELVDFHSSRPGHDLRYALDSSKLLASGYRYPVDFHESLERTVRWTVRHRSKWLYRD